MIRTSRRAVLYARFSSDNQRTESIDAQLRAMKAYCKQNQILIVDTYVDEAKSGTTTQRPAFQKMIADSKSRTFDIVLVHKLDRFARNRYDSAMAKRELKRNGVSLYSVLENLDNSPESIMMEAVLEGMSEYYSRNLAREVLKGLKENALQCKHTGGQPPLGYDVDKVTRKLVVNEEEAKAVRIIFEMYANGYSYKDILKVLRQNHCKTKKGTDFLKNSLYTILSNQKYQGIYVFNKSSAKSVAGTRNTHLLKSNEEIIAIEGGCPQIVAKEIYEKVQKRLTDNRHKGARLNAKRFYLLSGKVFCKNCGRSMCGCSRRSGRNKKLYITYACTNKKYQCDNREINCVYLERYVVGLLEKEIFNANALVEIAAKIKEVQKLGNVDNIVEIKRLQELLEETNQSIVNVTEILARGQMIESLLVKLTELEERKQALEISLLKIANEKEMQQSAGEKVIDIKHILAEYAKAKEDVCSVRYKEFIQDFIVKIKVSRYYVDIILKTGLGISSSLDKVVSVRRQEIYEGKTV